MMSESCYQMISNDHTSCTTGSSATQNEADSAASHLHMTVRACNSQLWSMNNSDHLVISAMRILVKARQEQPGVQAVCYLQVVDQGFDCNLLAIHTEHTSKNTNMFAACILCVEVVPHAHGCMDS